MRSFIIGKKQTNAARIYKEAAMRVLTNVHQRSCSAPGFYG